MGPQKIVSCNYCARMKFANCTRMKQQYSNEHEHAHACELHEEEPPALVDLNHVYEDGGNEGPPPENQAQPHQNQAPPPESQAPPPENQAPRSESQAPPSKKQKMMTNFIDRKFTPFKEATAHKAQAMMCVMNGWSYNSQAHVPQPWTLQFFHSLRSDFVPLTPYLLKKEIIYCP